MSGTKTEKPTLGGTRIRQRKRSINVPLDHSSFAEDVVAIFQDAALPDASVETNLLAGVKALEVAGADLDYSRYGDTLFELLFLGGRFAGGSMEVEYGESKLETNVFDCEPTTAAVKPYVVAVQHILRRRPFLVKALENTLKKLLQLLEHYSAAERDKIALLFAQVFIQRVGVPPENVFTVLLNDVLVANGTTLSFVTSLFREWLRESTLDELMAVLRRGKVEDRLLEFFPQQRRSAEAFAAHFGAEGLGPLVEHSRRRFAGERAKELRAALLELLSDGAATPASATEALELLKQRKTREQSLGDEGLPEAELVGAVWEALLGGAQLAAKGGQAQALTTQLVKGVRTWAKPLSFAASSARLEADLLSRVQTACYDDMALIKSFPEIVRHMYDKDVLSEETILAWYKKGANPKGRAVFVKDMEKFVTWLQEAEEEDSDEEPAAAVAALKV